MIKNIPKIVFISVLVYCDRVFLFWHNLFLLDSLADIFLLRAVLVQRRPGQLVKKLRASEPHLDSNTYVVNLMPCSSL
jgi:hypothetical protein